MEDGKQIQRIIDRLKMTPEAFARFRGDRPWLILAIMRFRKRMLSNGTIHFDRREDTWSTRERVG